MTTDDFGAPLPTEAHTVEGMVFNPSDERWKLRDTAGSLTINWRRFDRWMAPSLAHSFKHVILWYVENRALSTARNIHDRLAALLTAISASGSSVLKTFTQAHLQSYRSSLKPSEEWKLATLSGFFRRWSNQGHPGVDPAAVDFLEEITLKGNFKGVAVSTSDPTTGPFTVVEASAISAAVSDALATGRISLRQYCITVLMAALGSRAVQFAALKCCDLRPPDREAGSTQWILDVPRAKQRHQPARTQFKPRPLVPEIAELLQSQIEEVQQAAADNGETEIDPSQLPIFPNWTAIGAPNLKYHSTGTELGSEVTAALKAINARSERTGEAIAITARRFRYTVGTRAAEEGLGEYVIAELLVLAAVQIRLYSAARTRF